MGTAAASKVNGGRKVLAGQGNVELGPDAHLRGGETWRQRVAGRRQPLPLLELIPARHSYPVAWMLGEDELPSETRAALVLQARLMRGKALNARQVAAGITAWQRRDWEALQEVPFVIETLGWCYALPRLASVLPGDGWNTLYERVWWWAVHGAHAAFGAAPFPRHLLASELPWTLAYLFPEEPAAAALAERAREAAAQSLPAVTDGEGLLHSRQWPWQRPWLASLVRCTFISRTLRRPFLDAQGESQFSWMIRQVLRMMRRDGSQALCSSSAGRWQTEPMDAVLMLADDPIDGALAERLWPVATGGPNRAAIEPPLPDAGLESEWSEGAVLRGDWSSGSPLFTVAYADPELPSELSLPGGLLWSGPSAPRLRVNGCEQAADGSWQLVCWFSDADAVYLELELPLDGDWRIQRHMLLARRDHFFLLADAVLGTAEAAMDYELRLPTPPEVELVPGADTWEGVLSGRRRLAKVLPLALPEWRAAPAAAALVQTPNGLQLSQSARGARMFCPLFFDLDPKRFDRPLTWRPLTIAERRVIQPPDVATGYRIQVGAAQWMVYRSLAPTANRTILGQNLVTEFLVGRFLSDGTIGGILEIQ